MRVWMRAGVRAASRLGLFSGTMLLVSCGVAPEVRTAFVAGGVVPSASYELDAFDIQGNYAYVLGDNGNFFQRSPSSAAQFYVVNITNPAAPAVVSTTPVTGSIYYGQSGIRVQGQYVYLLSSTGTASTNLLQIFDVSNPADPSLVGSLEVPLYGFGLWVSGQYAYVASFVDTSSPSTLDVIDVSNPASPKVVGSTTTGTAGVNVADVKVVGNYAYMAGQSGAQSEVLVFDVSNPASPFLVSSLPATHSPQGLDVEGSYWYQSIYDGNALDIYDVSSPSSPVPVGAASFVETCKPQDVAVSAATAYVACYTNSSVAVVDVSTPSSPRVTGYIALPANSYPIFLEAKGRYVYSISNSTGGMFSVIDTGGA